ncbi:hypothetical protein K2173_004764 [Erythroxylum novogranatense]|uniref:Uncharacterized protein n=1 Tax=Erythroxylum novogranatense TaxID=1862640 RepID=A0AAV8SKF8_9ROSI|nr:hypothetical protein K2173_004764 [Erythroxylum novogranatense]
MGGHKECTAYGDYRRHSYASPPHPPLHKKPRWESAESKRKKRVAQYKLYAVEAKVKGTIKKGLRWFKKTCCRIVHGF